MSSLFIGVLNMKTLLLILFTQLVSASSSYFYKNVKPIFDNRCIVCHACYDSPCSLKLTSYEGVLRGGSKQDLYGNRIAEIPFTRLGKDAFTRSGWNNLGFHDVVKQNVAKESRVNNSLLFHFVSIGQTYNRPGKIKNVAQRSPHKCASNKEELFRLPENERANLGMPFGLPRLSNEEFKHITTWIQMGSPGPEWAELYPTLSREEKKTLRTWETFFNNESFKGKWTAKYLYEHIYLTHISFDSIPGRFYELVRSATPPGEGIHEIVTKFPYDSPGVSLFYYRLKPIVSTIVHKTHIVLELNDKKLKEWEELFYASDWGPQKEEVNWDTKNPFVNFRPIPAKIRYKWMLKNNHLIVDLFTRGPVCNGSIATYAVRDHFWAFFLHPDSDVSVNKKDYFDKAADLLAIPELDENLLHVFYANKLERYESFHAKQWKEFKQWQVLGLKDIWAGNKQGDTPLLTIVRHELSVSVHMGRLGKVPETFWVIDYPIFERIYYNLVASFNVYGSLDHKTATRIYMENLRREGEDNFIAFLDAKEKKRTRRKWYQKTITSMPQITEKELYVRSMETQFSNKSAEDVAVTFANGMSPVPQNLTAAKLFSKINEVKGDFNKFFRDVSYVRVQYPYGKIRYFSIIAHKTHKTMNLLFFEDATRSPESDTLTFVEDVQISYPNIFFDLKSIEVEKFQKDVLAVNTIKDYKLLERKYAIKKSDPGFWHFMDEMHSHFQSIDPVMFGRFDLNRYEMNLDEELDLKSKVTSGVVQMNEFIDEKKNELRTSLDKVSDFLNKKKNYVEKMIEKDISKTENFIEKKKNTLNKWLDYLIQE
jgi:hypothetical protein